MEYAPDDGSVGGQVNSPVIGFSIGNIVFSQVLTHSEALRFCPLAAQLSNPSGESLQALPFNCNTSWYGRIVMASPWVVLQYTDWPIPTTAVVFVAILTFVIFVIEFHSGHTANAFTKSVVFPKYGQTSTQLSGGAKIHQYPHSLAGPPHTLSVVHVCVSKNECKNKE